MQPSFTTIGDKMSLARISAYKTEVQKMELLKGERTSTIASLCDDINGLWAELGFGPSDEYDSCIVAPVSLLC
jgi:hypothetical protein